MGIGTFDTLSGTCSNTEPEKLSPLTGASCSATFAVEWAGFLGCGGRVGRLGAEVGLGGGGPLGGRDLGGEEPPDNVSTVSSDVVLSRVGGCMREGDSGGREGGSEFISKL